jgi:hypothetical protein
MLLPIPDAASMSVPRLLGQVRQAARTRHLLRAVDTRELMGKRAGARQDPSPGALPPLFPPPSGPAILQQG